MSRSSTRGHPNVPQWVYLNTAVDLKEEVLRRIEAYYDHEGNVSKTSELAHAQWLDGEVHKMNSTRTCQYAIDVLHLHTVKWVEGIQLSKRTMVLSPFDTSMEAPEETPTASTDDNVSTTIEIDSDIEKSRPTVEMATNMDISPAVVEGEMVMVPKSDEALQKLITNVVDTYFVTFRVKMMDDIQMNIRDTLNEFMEPKLEEKVTEIVNDKGTVKLKNLIDATTPQMLEKINQSLKESQTNYESNVKTLIKEQNDETVQNIHTKEQQVIKNLAIKRDELLQAINEEANQAIEDFLGATEKAESKHHEQTTPDRTGPTSPQKSNRFPNVNLDDIGLIKDEPYLQKHSNNGQANQSQQWRQPSDRARSSTSTYSAYGFHKYFKAKLRNDEQVLNFYQQLHIQGSAYGIHCIPLQDIRPNIDLCPNHFTHAQRNEMALTIYQKLQDEECVSVGYSKAQRIIHQYASISDGYRVVEQLLRFVHPNLKHSTSNTYDVPKLSNSYGNLYDYGSKLMNYILMQSIQHRTYTPTEQTVMFLNNMDDKKYHEAKNRALVEVRRMTNNGVDTLDPNLMLESLPTTLEQYHEQVYGQSDKTPSRFVRTLFEKDKEFEYCQEVDEDNVAVIRTFGKRNDYQRRPNFRSRYDRNSPNNSYRNSSQESYPKAQCRACGRWGCNERKCQFVARVHLAVKYIKDHSNAAAKLAEEYLRTNSKRTKMSTIRTLTASFGHSGSEGSNDEELLHQYDIDIPMEEIDFESNEE